MWRRIIKNRIIRIGLFGGVALSILCSFALPPDHITIFLAGDSTMSDKEIKAYPETGWGMPFKAFFDSSVSIKALTKLKTGAVPKVLLLRACGNQS